MPKCKCGCFYSGSYCHICGTRKCGAKNGNNRKRNKGIKKVSRKRRGQTNQYGPLRDEYLKKFPVCEVEHCQGVSVEIHHKYGKEGERLIDINHFLAVCRKCHDYIHDNHAWSVHYGYKELRSIVK